MNQIELANLKATADAVKNNSEIRYAPFSATLDWEEGTRNRVVVRDFEPIIIAEPADFGGKNEAPNPVEYLLSAAVGCFSIGFELFASQQGIKINSYHAEIAGELDLAAFFGFAEGTKGVQNITLKVTVDADAPKEKIQEIVAQAKKGSVVLNTLKPLVEVQYA